MKVFAIVALAVLASVSSVAAQTPVIGVYTDPGLTADCNLIEVVATVQSVWIVQESGPAVDAARFKVNVNNTGWAAMFLDAWYPVIYLVEPDIFGGDAFGLPECAGPPNAFARLDYIAFTPSPECAAGISVAPDPAAASGQIEATDCDGNVLLGHSGATVVVNSNPDTCPCTSGPVDAEDSTWGKVKALYR